MGPEHASREKKFSKVIFLIFVHKNVYRIRFKEIKFWTYSEHTLKIAWWYAQELTKSQQLYSLTDSPVSNMDPRDASASKNCVHNLGPKKNIGNVNKTMFTFGCLDLLKIGNLWVDNYLPILCLPIQLFYQHQSTKRILLSLRMLLTENRVILIALQAL